VLGALSVVFWALILIIGLKYAILILRADNHGEGGIVAMLAFALAGDSELVRRFAKAAIGTGIALVAVQFLNYLAP